MVPQASDTLTYPAWSEGGGRKRCLDSVSEKVEEMLATHEPTPLTPGQEADVARIVEEARCYYSRKGLM